MPCLLPCCVYMGVSVCRHHQVVFVSLCAAQAFVAVAERNLFHLRLLLLLLLLRHGRLGCPWRRTAGELLLLLLVLGAQELDLLRDLLDLVRRQLAALQRRLQPHDLLRKLLRHLLRRCARLT